MRLDNMKDAWQHHMREDNNLAGRLEDARARAAALDADVRRRDRRESVVALVMAPLFLLMAVAATTAMSRIGALVVVAACLYIPMRLRAARRTFATAGLPVADALRTELRQVQSQERLLGSATLWYFGPLGLGIGLYIAGGPAPVTFRAVMIAALVVLYGGLAAWNVRVARRDVAPVAAALRESLDELEHDNDSTEAPDDA